MIKKFKLFINGINLINENETIGRKTEYQIHHLSREKRFEYFEERLYYFKNSDFNDLNIEFGYDSNGNETEYFPFKDYEFSLCPKLLKEEYIKICIKHGLGIPKDEINTLSKNQKEKFLDSCAKNARQTYVKLDILKLFSDKQMYVYLNNLTKNERHLSNKSFNFLSDKFKKFYLDKCIQYKTSIGANELSWIEPEEDRKYYTDYYLKTCIEKGNKMVSNLLDLCTDEQKLVYYTKQVEKGIISNATSYNLKTGEAREIDWNKEELEALKNKLAKK